MTNQRLQIVAFLLVFIVMGLIVALMWWPFLKLLALVGILAILFLPVYDRLFEKFKSEPLAALLTLLAILLIVMVPLYVIGQLLFNELIGLYNQLRGGSISISKSQIVESLPFQLQPVLTNFLQDLGSKLSNIAANAFQGVTGVLSNIAGFFLSFFLVFFSLYYFLRDGKKIKGYISGVFPLSQAHENVLVSKLEDAVVGVVKGSFLVALIQGTVATVGYLIFGVPNPFLWGVFTVLAALVPTVGTSLAIIPAVLYLLISGSTGAAVGLGIWGAAAVGTIDNIVSPKLIGSRTRLHPLLVLFGVLGGMRLFGFIGFLLGPIIMAVFVALLDIYRQDLKQYLEK